MKLFMNLFILKWREMRAPREWCSQRSMYFVLVDRAYLSRFVVGKF